MLILGLSSPYEVEHLARVFFPGAPLRAGRGTKGPLVYARAGRCRLVVGLRDEAGRVAIATQLRAAAGAAADDTNTKRELSRLLYDLLRRITGQRPPWGMLTGVRPVRLYRNSFATGGQAAAEARLLREFDISPEKYALLRQINHIQAPVLARLQPLGYSLYVSIPFCPSRCAYCSFVSRTTERDGHLIEPYLDLLEQELVCTAGLARDCGLMLETIYIGGGTPTALTAPQLERLLKTIARLFDTAAAMEYTVEAGRPDCTTPEKLALLKAYGVGRISINPQTLQDEVLCNIGRRHTAEDIRRCYAEARQAGHSSINMDLIAGLPGDTPSAFSTTLDEVIALAPENITLHTLTLKRASNLVIDQGGQWASSSASMVELAGPKLLEAGYEPYYLYRQKSTVDNLENTGWTKPGQEGVYNIGIMEEVTTILACGAGGVTKLVPLAAGGATGKQAKMQRIFNQKLPLEYIRQFDELICDKQGVKTFYASHLDTQTSR